MKVTNWRRKLAAALVAGGLISPSAASAANLNVNLVPDPQFSMVTTPAVRCCFGSYQLDSWNDGTQPAFAYNNSVTTYDSGGPLPGGGNYYFTSGRYSGGEPPDITMPGQVSENIDVSTGATLAQIDSGEAVVRMSAFFTSYGTGQSTLNTEGDLGFVHVDFLNGAASSLGTAQISRRVPQVNGWNQNSGVFPVPVGARTLKVSLFGAAASTGPDAYIDIVDVQVRDAEEEVLFLEVRTSDGRAVIRNNTGEEIPIDFYEITSSMGSLRPANWSSLQDQNLTGFPAGNGSGNGWEENARSNSGRLGEGILASSSLVGGGPGIGLGTIVNPAGEEDLVFRYGLVEPQVLRADFDGSGFVDGNDVLRWQRGSGLTGAAATKDAGNADGDSDVDAADLAIWAGEFGSTTLSGPSKIMTGFVRYVPGIASVPEPATVWLAGLGIAALAVRGRAARHALAKATTEP